MSRVRCEVCGRKIETGDALCYLRAPTRAATVRSRSLERCGTCHRRGCPSCLSIVEERADDFFFDVFLCRDCLPREIPPSLPDEY